jgi:hypothetical protein
MLLSEYNIHPIDLSELKLYINTLLEKKFEAPKV